jgi:hypothetical protein
MARIEFEPTIPVFEREKTFHALDLAATVVGNIFQHLTYKLFSTMLHIGIKVIKHFCSSEFLIIDSGGTSAAILTDLVVKLTSTCASAPAYKSN